MRDRERIWHWRKTLRSLDRFNLLPWATFLNYRKWVDYITGTSVKPREHPQPSQWPS
jgi:hypothetical protein